MMKFNIKHRVSCKTSFLLFSLMFILILSSLPFTAEIAVAKSQPQSQTQKSRTSAKANANAKAKSDEQAIAQLKQILGPFNSLQGDFQQKVMNEKGKTLSTSSGKMWLKKPGQFRWEVQGKDKRLVVSDGKEVWDFDPDLSQATVQKLPRSKGSTPIYFLTGDVNSLNSDFVVKSLGEDRGDCLPNSDACFELKPRGNSSNFQWIRVGFHGNVLKEIELLDQLGQHSIFTFQNLSSNANISPKQFHFAPPKGVEVVRN